LSLTGWKRLTAVGSGAGVDLYLDGVLVGSHASTIGTGVRYILGDGDAGGMTRAFGAAADFFIWRRGLSATEVAAHARQPYRLLRSGEGPWRSGAPAPPALLPPFRRIEPSTHVRM